MGFFLKLIKLLAAVLLLGAGVYFAINNNHDLIVRVPVTDQTVSMNVSLALFLAFTVGICFTAIFFGYEWMRKALDVKKLRKQLLALMETTTDNTHSAQAEASPRWQEDRPAP